MYEVGFSRRQVGILTKLRAEACPVVFAFSLSVHWYSQANFDLMLKYYVKIWFYISQYKSTLQASLGSYCKMGVCKIVCWEFTLLLTLNKHSDPHLSAKNGLLVSCFSGDNDKPGNFCWHTRDGEFQMETRNSLLSLVQIHLSVKKPQASSHWALKISAHFSLTEHHPTFHFNFFSW